MRLFALNAVLVPGLDPVAFSSSQEHHPRADARQRRAVDAAAPVDAKSAPTGACKTAQTRFCTAPTAFIVVVGTFKPDENERQTGKTDRCRDSVSST